MSHNKRRQRCNIKSVGQTKHVLLENRTPFKVTQRSDDAGKPQVFNNSNAHCPQEIQITKMDLKHFYVFAWIIKEQCKWFDDTDGALLVRSTYQRLLRVILWVFPPWMLVPRLIRTFAERHSSRTMGMPGTQHNNHAIGGKRVVWSGEWNTETTIAIWSASKVGRCSMGNDLRILLIRAFHRFICAMIDKERRSNKSVVLRCVHIN